MCRSIIEKPVNVIWEKVELQELQSTNTPGQQAASECQLGLMISLYQVANYHDEDRL